MEEVPSTLINYDDSTEVVLFMYHLLNIGERTIRHLLGITQEEISNIISLPVEVKGIGNYLFVLS
jgi:hypothetical protein